MSRRRRGTMCLTTGGGLSGGLGDAVIADAGNGDLGDSVNVSVPDAKDCSEGSWDMCGNAEGESGSTSLLLFASRELFELEDAQDRTEGGSDEERTSDGLNPDILDGRDKVDAQVRSDEL